MANQLVEKMAKSFIKQLNDVNMPIEDAMEIVNAVTLAVATVGGITGTSTNGKMTILMQMGTPEQLGIDTTQYTDRISTVGTPETRH